MKNQISGFVKGVIVTLLIVAGVINVSASIRTQNAVLNYNDIKICVDGTYITPKDANGNMVEPFIIDGTTYLPVRAVASALGKAVQWDGKTSTVFLGERPANSSGTNDVNEEKDKLTVGQKNALKSAENYLDFMAFSRKGLIRQLEFEGYSKQDATFAVDNVEVNWDEECYECAKNYLDIMAFSKSSLINQLEFEGYTDEQIDYAIKKVGY